MTRRFLPLLAAVLLASCAKAPAPAPAPRSAADIQLDRLLGDDAGASREEACRMAREGKEALARLEGRLASMDSVTPAEKERAASVVAVAVLYTVPRAELADWPVLAETVQPWVQKGREICGRMSAREHKFWSPGLAKEPDRETKPDPMRRDGEALFRLQGLALEGIADLCASDNAETRAFGVSQVFHLEAFMEQPLIDQVERAGGQYDSFDGCSLHHDSVGEHVAELKKDSSYWVARRESSSELNRIASSAELMAGSLQRFFSVESDPSLDLTNPLRQAGGMAGWNAKSWDDWWTVVRPVWDAYWNEFAGKSGKTEAEWRARVKQIEVGR